MTRQPSIQLSTTLSPHPGTSREYLTVSIYDFTRLSCSRAGIVADLPIDVNSWPLIRIWQMLILGTEALLSDGTGFMKNSN